MTTSTQHLPDHNPGNVIDVVATTQVELVPPTVEAVVTAEVIAEPGAGESIAVQAAGIEPIQRQNGHSGGALVTSRGNFGAYLAPLTKDTFKGVVDDVHQKLQVMSDTLSLLDNLLDAQGFDAILDEMLRSITLKTGELLNADRSTIFLLDEEKNELWSIVAKDERGNNLELRFPANVGIAGEVATTKQVVNIPFDFYDDPRSTAAQRLDKQNHYRTYTMLAMPLLNTEGTLVAVVQLINKLKPDYNHEAPLEEKINQQGFTADDERVFEEFAPSIRLIIESSRSFYKATQRQRAASALMNAVKSLSKSSLDLEETLKQVMNQAKELMQADRSTLWLVDEGKESQWTLIEQRDGTYRELPVGGMLWAKILQPDGSSKKLEVPVGKGYVGKVAASGEPLNIPFDLYDDADSEVSKRLDQSNGYRTCSLLCMPIFNADGRLIGVTQLVNKTKQGEYADYDPANYPQPPERWKASFNRNDQEFMQAFNIQAGVALQNAKLFQTVKQQEQMQRDILRSLTNGVISTDKDGRIIAANESARSLLGVDQTEDIEGQKVEDLVQIKKGDFSRWFHAALEARDEKSRQQYYPDQMLECVAGSIEEHSINLSINTIADASDSTRVSGALVVMEDISDEKRLKSTMYRYMTQELAEQLLENPDAAKMGGDRKPVSVLFSDIRSYTTLTESMEAEQVVEMLNKYFELMVDAVFEHKGTLDKYIGDAIMAVFGSPIKIDDHEWMAVQTAVDMRHRLKHFNRERQEQDKQPIRIGIGINSDIVISGNIGSSKRMEFTAIGDGVNLGSRLESASKIYGTDIIISENTYNPCAERVWVRELDYIKVKGKDKPVKVYELIGLRDVPLADDKLRTIDLYHKGLELFRERKFRKAWNEFATIIEEVNRTDKAADLYMKRCDRYLQSPPDEDWDGSETLTEK